LTTQTQLIEFGSGGGSQLEKYVFNSLNRSTCLPFIYLPFYHLPFISW